MMGRVKFMGFYCASLVVVTGLAAASDGQDAALDAVRKHAEKREQAFNAANVDALVGMFLPDGELIDEEGVVYKGQPEIKTLLTGFFERFPGATLKVDVENVRLTGPVAIEEGTRTMKSGDGSVESHFRYIAVWSQADGAWRLASFRDFVDEPEQTPHARLEPLAWLVGDWVNEGADGKVAVTYRWSDDENYLLGDFDFTGPDGVRRKSTQRLGWDPAAGTVRAWLFDADGGFAEGSWTVLEDGGVVVKSNSVNPDGSSSSATLTITPTDKDHYTIAGSDRIVGGARAPDFEITVTRRPPQAAR